MRISSKEASFANLFYSNPTPFKGWLEFFTQIFGGDMMLLGLVNTLVTHANMKGFGLASLSGALHGFMPSQLKTNPSKSAHCEGQKSSRIF